MKKFKDFKKEVLKNKKILKEYESLRPEYEAIQKIIDLRLKKGMTQGQLAKKLGTKQSAVSRLERQLVNPTVSFLSRLATVFGKKLVIEFK
jgi:ribosome-binding protein aMBF1 (putative translation factor)